MPNYEMPPWVGRPADPAAHYAQGFQIGVHLGAQQAAQQFQAQQLAQQQQKMALAQQQQEFENQYQAQVLSLKAGEMARQHQAAQMYIQMVGSGMDPSRALMQLAPELGESPAAIINAQRQRDAAQANMVLGRQRMQFQQAQENRIKSQRQESLLDADERLRQAKEKELRMAKQGQEKIETQKAAAAQRTRQTAEKALLQDPNYLKLQADLNTSTRLLNERIAKGKGFFGNQATLEKEVEALTQRVANKQKEIQRFHDNAIANVPPAAFVAPEAAGGEEEEEPGSVGGTETPPPRVRMKSPNGKTGTLPADQVEAAIAQGWTKL